MCGKFPHSKPCEGIILRPVPTQDNTDSYHYCSEATITSAYQMIGTGNPRRGSFIKAAGTFGHTKDMFQIKKPGMLSSCRFIQ